MLRRDNVFFFKDGYCQELSGKSGIFPLSEFSEKPERKSLRL